MRRSESPRSPATRTPQPQRLFPHTLQPGDVWGDAEDGTDWTVVGRPMVSREGKRVSVPLGIPGHARAERVGNWPAHRKVTVWR